MIKLLSPFLPYIIGGLMALGVVTGIWRSGYNTAWREARVEGLKAEIATLKQDAKIAETARKDAETKNAELEQQAQADKEILDAFRKRLGNGDASRFRLSNDDAEWLRKLRQ